MAGLAGRGFMALLKSRQPLSRLCSAAGLSILTSVLLLPACRCLQDFICVCPEVVKKKVPVVPVVSAVPTPAPAPTVSAVPTPYPAPVPTPAPTAYGGK
jgi:hypothetical protein